MTSKKFGCDKRTFNKLIKENDILFLIGARNNGKSYQSKDYVYNDFLKNGNEFIYLRRFQYEAVKSKANMYFENMPFADEITAGVKIFQRTSEGKKERIGHYLDLQNSEKMLKSIAFPKVNTIIFEECLTKDYYLDNETSLLENLISTVYRERETGKIILIGNLVSPFNPYKDSWGIDTSYSEKVDDNKIRKYVINGLNVCVWCVPPNDFKTKMAIGKVGSKLDRGVYEIEQYNIIPDDIDYRAIYTFYIEYQELTFKCDFVRVNDDTIVDGYSIFIDYHEYDEDKKKCELAPKYSRVISERFTFDVRTTPYLTPLNSKEKIVFDYLKNGNCCYATNEIGTFFNQAIKKFI